MARGNLKIPPKSRRAVSGAKAAPGRSKRARRRVQGLAWRWLGSLLCVVAAAAAAGGLLVGSGRVYALDAFSNPIPSGFDLISFSASGCPAGFVEDTAGQGFYLIGRASSGTVGNSIGTAISGATPPDVTYTPVGTNSTCPTQPAVTTAGTISACAPAFTPNFTGSANSTMRSTIAPAMYVLICKKS